MKIAIVGSRDFSGEPKDSKSLGFLNLVVGYVNALPLDTIIVSGGARGVDITAENTARLRGMTVISYEPDWDKYGKSAGMIRNKDIINAADEVVAFHDGKSRGTQNSIDLALSQNKPLTIVFQTGKTRTYNKKENS